MKRTEQLRLAAEMRQQAQRFFEGGREGRLFLGPMTLGAELRDVLPKVVPDVRNAYVVDNSGGDGYLHRTYVLLLAAEVLEDLA